MYFKNQSRKPQARKSNQSINKVKESISLINNIIISKEKLQELPKGESQSKTVTKVQTRTDKPRG